MALPQISTAGSPARRTKRTAEAPSAPSQQSSAKRPFSAQMFRYSLCAASIVLRSVRPVAGS